MGEFTTRFDAEIMKSKFAELERERQAKEREQQEKDRIDRMLDEVAALLEKRANFIAERFNNAVREDLDEKSSVGFQFRFAETADRRGAMFSLAAHIKESRLALVVESRFNVPALKRAQYDYVTLPISQPDIERARRFVESKLFDFARDYVRL